MDDKHLSKTEKRWLELYEKIKNQVEFLINFYYKNLFYKLEFMDNESIIDIKEDTIVNVLQRLKREGNLLTNLTKKQINKYINEEIKKIISNYLSENNYFYFYFLEYYKDKEQAKQHYKHFKSIVIKQIRGESNDKNKK